MFPFLAKFPAAFWLSVQSIWSCFTASRLIVRPRYLLLLRFLLAAFLAFPSREISSALTDRPSPILSHPICLIVFLLAFPLFRPPLSLSLFVSFLHGLTVIRYVSVLSSESLTFARIVFLATADRLANIAVCVVTDRSRVISESMIGCVTILLIYVFCHVNVQEIWIGVILGIFESVFSVPGRFTRVSRVRKPPGSPTGFLQAISKGRAVVGLSARWKHGRDCADFKNWMKWTAWKHWGITFWEVDIERDDRIAAEIFKGASRLPEVRFFKEGNCVASLSGFNRQELEAMLVN
jgi:hypothetical protein